MNRPVLLALLLIVASAVGPAERARAQAVEPGGSANPALPEASEAARLYEEGQRYFRIADYGPAIERLKAAYLKAPLPELLYDLGQAFRLKGDCAEALSFYRRFAAAAPPGPRLERTKARIADMEQCVARGATTPAPPGGAAAIVPSVPAPAEARSRPSPPVNSSAVAASSSLLDVRDSNAAEGRIGRRRLGVAVGVAAAALAITSATFAWRASSAADEASARFVPGSTWTGASQDTERTGVLSDRVAIATGLGALLAAGVATWLYWK